MNNMNNINALLITDFYKLCHMMQYDENIVQMASYLTPRKSRLAETHGINNVIMFGLQAYIESFVIKAFNDNFFAKPWDEIENDIIETLHLGLGFPQTLIMATLDKVHKLHSLGYLPVVISGVEEGTIVPMGVPCVMITSTDKDLPWVGQVLEASLSAAIWHPMVCATIAFEYRKIANKAWNDTCDCGDPRNAMCDFSMRGQESIESAVAASAAWLTCMHNSSTVYARKYIEQNYGQYGCYHSTELDIKGLASTEHSVMTSQAAIDGSEENTFKRLFELYNNASFSVVCDSYDFWNVVENILPKFKDTIVERGKHGHFIGIRHDSSEPVFALCGYQIVDRADQDKRDAMDKKKIPHMLKNSDGLYNLVTYSESGERVEDPNARTRTLEEMGLVEALWELFGGHTNRKGYKSLIPGIKAVYGDSITITRATHIYDQLKSKGFAASNVSLGVGSFSFQAIEDEDGNIYPFTRDTFSIAMKCTWVKMKDGTEYDVFKAPKGMDEKKSIKGLVAVESDLNGVAYIVPKCAAGDRILVPSSDDVNTFSRQARLNYMPRIYFIGMPKDKLASHRDKNTANINWMEQAYAQRPVMRFAEIRSRINFQSKFLPDTFVCNYTDKQAADIVEGKKYYDVIKPHFQNWAEETGAKDFVVGMSGGKDSTVVAMLCAKIFGKSHVYGLSMSNGYESYSAKSDGQKVSALIGIDCPDVNIGDAVNSITENLEEYVNMTNASTINLPCRMRMTTLFAYGQCIDGRVINTSNLSEDTVGYATQFGDNAGCYAPIQNLTVTEVKQLGVYLACELGIADEMEPWINKVPADGLQPKTDEDNLGFKYADLDKLIRTGEGTDELKETVMRMYKANRFKTEIVNMPKPAFDLPNYIVKWYAEENEKGVKPW